MLSNIVCFKLGLTFDIVIDYLIYKVLQLKCIAVEKTGNILTRNAKCANLLLLWVANARTSSFLCCRHKNPN